MSRFVPVALLLLAAPVVAAPVPKDSGKAEMERLWNQLTGESSLTRTESVCRFLAQPDEAVRLFDLKLRPLALHPKDAEKLIEQLASPKEAEWKAAFDELMYLDPRLAMPVDECWALAKTDTQRRRLAWVLHGEVIEGTDDSVFTLKPPKSNGDFDFGELSWLPKPGVKAMVPNFGFVGVAKDVRELRSDRCGDKWSRQTLAVQMLTRMDTPAGWKIIERMAEGHPEAEPTIDAQIAMKWKESGKPFERWDREKLLADQHNRDWDKLQPLTNREEQVQAVMGFVLDRPAESVQFFKSKLRPLKLDKKRADELVKQLFSEKEAEWKAAVGEFAKLDLRLAYPARDAWKLAETADERSKMAMALHQNGARVMDGLLHYDLVSADEVELSFVPVDKEFVKHGVIYQKTVRPDVPPEVAEKLGGAEYDVCAPGDFASLNVLLWHREESAISILDAIGTDDAVAIIKDMATGHPDAGPTKAAKEVLKRRGVK
jgi:hypothetical protein